MSQHGTALNEWQMADFVGAGMKALILVAGRLGPELARNWAKNGPAMEGAFLSALMPSEEQIDPQVGKGKHLINLDEGPHVPNDWKVEKHIRDGQFEWDPLKVALYLSESQQDGKGIRGDELQKELMDKPVFNANLLDYLLVHPELIPEEWKGKLVFFWGTIYRHVDGYLRVRCLRWFDDGWHWHFSWLDHDFHGSDPAAVPAST